MWPVLAADPVIKNNRNQLNLILSMLFRKRPPDVIQMMSFPRKRRQNYIVHANASRPHGITRRGHEITMNGDHGPIYDDSC